jgi:hypothetical protein
MSKTAVLIKKAKNFRSSEDILKLINEKLDNVLQNIKNKKLKQ